MKQEIGATYIDLNGNFETSDGSVGMVATTPELAELNAFLGVLSGSIASANPFDRALCRIVKQFKQKVGAVLQINSYKDGKELVHTFRVITQRRPLSYKETDALLTKNGWNLDCWSPLEISCGSSFASGEAAQIVIDQIRAQE